MTTVDRQVLGDNVCTFYAVDIKIERECYMYMWKYNISQSTLTKGAKIIFRIKNSRIKMPNKLCLSTYEHNFPEGTTKYWFGIMKPTDITQNTSEVHNAIFNQ